MREKRKASHVSYISTRHLRPYHSIDFQNYSPSLILLWAHQHSQLYSHLCLDVTREVVSYLSACELLPGIYNGHLCVANAHSEMFRLVPSIERDWRFILLVDDSTAICIAEVNEAYLAYWLDLLTLGISEFLMLQPSLWTLHPCYLSQTLYVFWYTSVDYKVRKYSVNHEQWSPLTNTEIHGSIIILVPHVTRIFIFLCNQTYQVFNTLTDQTCSQTALPWGLELHANCPWAISSEGKLLFLGRGNTFWTWDWETNTTSYVFELPGKGLYPEYQGATLLIGKKMYWLGRGSQLIHSFNIEKLEKRTAKLLQG